MLGIVDLFVISPLEFFEEVRLRIRRSRSLILIAAGVTCATAGTTNLHVRLSESAMDRLSGRRDWRGT